MTKPSNDLTAAVTGATGTIGRHLVRLLKQQGWKVKVLSRKAALDDTEVELIKGSLADMQALTELVKNVDAVFHCAAEVFNNQLMREVNVNGTANLLKALDGKHLDYFCHISSAIVVGSQGQIVITEETECHPKTEYEKTKWEAEQLVRHWQGCKKICILRPTDGFDTDSLGVLRLGLNNRWRDKGRVLIQGNLQTHLVYVVDVAAAALFFYPQKIHSPACFFVSCDEDKLNTVAGVYTICRTKISGSLQKIPFTMPVFIPNVLRYLRHGKSLHAGAKFSSANLRAQGFEFQYGLKGGIEALLKQRGEMK